MKNWSNSFLTKSLTDRGLKKRPIKWDFPWYSAWSYRHADNPHTGTHWHQEQKFWILSFHQLHAILKIKISFKCFISINTFLFGQTHTDLVSLNKSFQSLSRRIVFSVFVSSQGVPSSAKFGTEVTHIARGLNMTCFYVFKYIGLHFGLSPTVATLPISTLCFLHLRSDKFIHI